MGMWLRGVVIGGWMHQNIAERFVSLQILHCLSPNICQIRFGVNPLHLYLLRLNEKSYDVIAQFDMLIGRCDLSHVRQLHCISIV